MYKNMKIAITDEVHLNAVCDVLERMGYHGNIGASRDTLLTSKFGKYFTVECCTNDLYVDTTLTNLLALRDKQFMEKIHA